MRSGKPPQCDVGWNASWTPRFGYVRMLASSTIFIVTTFVRFVCHASANISNCTSSSSPKSSGAPIGASGRFVSDSLLAMSFSTRFSTSRTESR